VRFCVVFVFCIFCFVVLIVRILEMQDNTKIFKIILDNTKILKY